MGGKATKSKSDLASVNLVSSKWDEEGIARSLAATRRKFLRIPGRSDMNDRYYLNFDHLVFEERQCSNDGFLIQHAVKTFFRTLLNGIILEVVADNGNIIATDCAVDFEMRAMYLSVQDVKRRILLDDIEGILSKDELRRMGIGTSNEIYLNEACTTLVIKKEQYLTFRFDTVRMRQYFEACLQALIASRLGATSRDIAK